METLTNNKKQEETHSAVYPELLDVHLEVVAGGGVNTEPLGCWEDGAVLKC